MTMYGVSGYDLGEPVIYGNGGNAVQQVAGSGQDGETHAGRSSTRDGVRVFVPELGRVFPTYKDAAEALGVSASSMRNAARRGSGAVGGHAFQVLD